MSKELREVAEAYREQALKGAPCALATLVRVRGSSFRRAGARMLIGRDADLLAGCVSAGCLEADVAEWGARVIESGSPKLLTYSARDDGADDEVPLNVAPACDGIIDILVEPLAASSAEAITLPIAALESGEAATLVSIFQCENRPELVGSRVLISSSGAVSGSITGDDANRLSAMAGSMPAGGPADVMAVEVAGEQAWALFESVRSAPRLVIHGAGSGSAPLAKMADLLGWRIVVADHRPAYLRTDRFPASSQIVRVRPEELLGVVGVDSRTACVIMTHIDSCDRALLAALSATDAFYVGILGSRRRVGGMIADLRDEGIDVPGRLGARLHGPVGLDLGGTDPDAIALSIVAEIQASLTGASGGRSIETKSARTGGSRN